MREMRPAELQAYLAAADEVPLLLDVREPWEFDICRLPDSQLIPMGQILLQLDRLSPDRETVVICHHGIRSRVVAMQLERAGFGRVINLAGGVEAWAREVDRDMPVY
jgi:rhodanese-related sulfurtransferase